MGVQGTSSKQRKEKKKRSPVKRSYVNKLEKGGSFDLKTNMNCHVTFNSVSAPREIRNEWFPRVRARLKTPQCLGCHTA